MTIILFILIPVLNAFIDYLIISKGAKIKHTVEALIRGILIGAIAYNTAPHVAIFILGCSIFWLLFELILNTLRGKPLLYVGYTAFTDKLIRRIFPKPEIPLFTVKILILCLTIHFGLV